MFQFLPAPLLATIPLRKGVELDDDDKGPTVELDDRGPAVELDDDDTLRLRWMAGPVDHVKSCMFSYGCILQPLPSSTFCRFHHRIMVYLGERVPRSRIPRSCIPCSRYRRHLGLDAGLEADVEFIRPDDDCMVIISSIHQLNAKFKLWTTDCEFGTVKGAHYCIHTYYPGCTNRENCHFNSDWL